MTRFPLTPKLFLENFYLLLKSQIVRNFILLSCFAALTLCAAAQNSTLSNSELDKHVMAISEQLRCLVCQNQTIADSHADLAVDLRNQVREKIQQGLSDKEIYDYMVQRYGDFVLYRPPLHTTTVLLWFAGLIFLGMKLRRPGAMDEPSESDMQRSAELLEGKTNDKEQL